MQNPAYWRDIINQILETDLTEARIDWLRKNYPDKIQANKTLRIPVAVQAAVNNTPGETREEKLINWVADQDPSKNHSYTQWMLDRILKPNGMPTEDILYAREILTSYQQARKQGLLTAEQQDINRFADLSAVQALVLRGQQTKQAQDAETAQAQLNQARNESDIIWEAQNFLVVAPKTVFAAQYWGRGSAWCTAYGDPQGRYPDRKDNAFETYYEGPLSIIIVRDPQSDSHMFQMARGELKDVDDENASVDDLFYHFPGAVSFDAVANLLATIGNLTLHQYKKPNFEMLVYTGSSDDLPDGPIVCLTTGRDTVCWKPWEGVGGYDWMLRNRQLLPQVRAAVKQFSQEVDTYTWSEIEQTPEEIAKSFMDNLLARGVYKQFR